MIPLIFFPRVVSPRASRPRRLDGLAVDAAGARLRLLPGGLPDPAAQGVVDLLPSPVATPLMEVVADRPLGREVVGQGGPGAAGAQDVGDGVEDLAEVGLPRRPGPYGGRQQWLQDRPLLVAEVAGIGLARLGANGRLLDSGADRKPQLTRITTICPDAQDSRALS